MSAPRSPRICVAAGPANTRDKSSTRTPLSTFHIARTSLSTRRCVHDGLADGHLEAGRVLAPDVELVDRAPAGVRRRATNLRARHDHLVLVDRRNVFRAQPALACGI